MVVKAAVTRFARNALQERVMNTRTQLSRLDGPSDSKQRTEVLFWDGRLDNGNDLRLMLSNSLQNDTTNAALALAAYERWGTSGFVHLIGDWSVVVRDHSNRTVILASD